MQLIKQISKQNKIKNGPHQTCIVSTQIVVDELDSYPS